jgi:hypothetical protein
MVRYQYKIPHAAAANQIALGAGSVHIGVTPIRNMKMHLPLIHIVGRHEFPSQ